MNSSLIAKPFHITIASAPTAKLSLEHDLRMVKTALLYADAVRLCSVTTSIVLQVAAIGDLKPEEQARLIKEVLPVLASYEPGKFQEVTQFFEKYERLARRKFLRIEERAIKQMIERKISKMWNEPGGMRETAYRIAQEAGAEGIVQAFELGVLELHVFQMAGDTDAFINDFMNVIGQTIADASTYPLFDDQTGNLAKLALQEGKLPVSPGSAIRKRQVSLAANLIERLPMFDLAALNEITDIRKELERPLVRFRGAIVQFSEKIKAESWDDDFVTEADMVFYRDVEPTVSEIEDAVRSNTYLRNLVSSYVDTSLKVLSGYGLGVLLSQLSALPSISQIALIGSVPAASVAYTKYNEWRDNQEKIEQNQLYFYYSARQKLSNSRLR